MEQVRAQPTGRGAQHDLPLTDREFARIAAYLMTVSGIHMPETNRALVYSRLSRRLRQLHLRSFDEYADLLESGDSADEREVMVAALTTNTTRFFREPYHFATFEEEILPTLMHDAERGKRVRLWSAGCATGEEPYSLAAVVQKTFPQAARYDFKILATDINQEVLSTARSGQYPQALAERVPEQYLGTMFEAASGGQRKIRAEVQALISFRYLNFMEPWPVSGPFQTVFCRNVVIYMQPETQSRIWAGMASVMAPGATLFIGHSERIGNALSDRFSLVGKTTFRRM